MHAYINRVKKVIFCLIISFMLICPLGCTRASEAKVLSRCAQIYLDDGTFGSGFFINGDGLILTCEHIIRNAYYDKDISIKIICSTGEYYATIINVETDKDLAMLRINAKSPNFFSLARTCVKRGDSVRIIANDGAGYVTSSGKIYLSSTVTTIGEETSRIIQVQMPTAKGSSGAPLVNDCGELVGMVKAKLVDKDIALCLDKDELTTFARENI